jgi:hypothetical protein
MCTFWETCCWGSWRRVGTGGNLEVLSVWQIRLARCWWHSINAICIYVGDWAVSKSGYGFRENHVHVYINPAGYVLGCVASTAWCAHNP